MASEDSFIALLRLIRTNLYRYGGPTLMSLGGVSCIMSLLVFTKKNLRKNPCSIYLVALNVSNFLLIFSSLLIATLAYGYNIDPDLYHLNFSRFHFYTMFLFDVLFPSYLILASVDRIFITSRNVRTRQRSTRRLAFLSIIVTTLFWMLLHSHALFITNFIPDPFGSTSCYFQPGLQIMLMEFYSVIIKGIVIPLLMIVLGLWSVRNVRRVTLAAPVAVVPILGTVIPRNTHAHRSKDHQLLRILLTDIIVYVIFNLMIIITLMYQQFKKNQFGDRTAIEFQTFLVIVGTYSAYIPFCVGCYTNLIASKAFRHEVKKILMWN